MNYTSGGHNFDNEYLKTGKIFISASSKDSKFLH